MHVTPFSAATILVFAIASPLHAQGIEVFDGRAATQRALSLALHAIHPCVIY